MVNSSLMRCDDDDDVMMMMMMMMMMMLLPPQLLRAHHRLLSVHCLHLTSMSRKKITLKPVFPPQINLSLA